MGRAYFDVSPELIEAALEMPKAAHIYGCEWSFAANAIRLYVNSPTLPETPEGSHPISVMPTVTESDDGIAWYWNLDGDGNTSPE